MSKTKYFLPALLMAMAFLFSCQREIIIPVEENTFPIPANSHPKGPLFQQLLEDYTRKGLVGVSLAIDDPQSGFWAGASGMAQIESGMPMTKYHLHRSASITKMYTGAAIMRLKELGEIDLEATIDAYLPATIYNQISNGDKITIRQLLSHSSGLYDYTGNPQFYFEQLNDPGGIDYTPLELLEFLYQKPAEFDPGTKTYYSNSNFLLLAIIIDFITGDSHAHFFKNEFFDPNGLNQTYYKLQPGYPNPPGIVNAYGDWYANGKLINITDIYNFWEVMAGDDALVASNYDYLLFTKTLFEGGILNQASLDEMKQWQAFEENDGRLTQTGLGIQYWQNENQTIWAMGHRGATIGTGGYVFYFPETGSTVSLFTNTGCERGPYGQLLDELFEDLAEMI